MWFVIYWLEKKKCNHLTSLSSLDKSFGFGGVVTNILGLIFFTYGGNIWVALSASIMDFLLAVKMKNVNMKELKFTKKSVEPWSRRYVTSFHILKYELRKWNQRFNPVGRSSLLRVFHTSFSTVTDFPIQVPIMDVYI